MYNFNQTCSRCGATFDVYAPEQEGHRNLKNTIVRSVMKSIELGILLHQL